MAVSYASNRVTITAYKTGTTVGTSSGTTLNITSGEIVAGDVGRMVAVITTAGSSSSVQVRTITAVSGGTITLHDDWNGTIASGVTWRVSHNLEDIHAIGDGNLQKIGNSTYRWNADWAVTGTGFLADTNVALEMLKTSGSPQWPINEGGIVQFGQLWGGEGIGTETTDGCRLMFQTQSNTISVYSSTNDRQQNGGVLNYYNCLIHSIPNGTSWMFQRMTGPTRFIGCNFDGVIGGRFYHEASEWVQCRMTGNNNTIPAWSIGATFDRDISDIKFYYNLLAMKNYITFGGTLRNVEFSNNTSIFWRDQFTTADSVFNFIDCTEFGATEVAGTFFYGVINQLRSVIFKTTDSSGTDLSNVLVRINNNEDATQGIVETSDVNGDVNEILALRIQSLHNNSNIFTDYFPFRIRVRKYAYLWSSLNSDIADPIKQSVALLEDTNVTQASGTAAAHTGITVTDHGVSPVLWNGKDWGITVECNLTTNPSLTIDDIKHYLHYYLSQDSAFSGKPSGLDWHNMIPMSGNSTQRGQYNGILKGVRIIDENDNAFIGVESMQADDGTFYIPTYLQFVGIDTWSVYPTDADRNADTNESGAGTGTQVFEFIFIPATTYYLRLEVSGEVIFKDVTPLAAGVTLVSLDNTALLSIIVSQINTIDTNLVIINNGVKKASKLIPHSQNLT